MGIIRIGMNLGKAIMGRTPPDPDETNVQRNSDALL